MAQKQEENFNCYVGTPIFSNGQWRCDTTDVIIQNPTTLPIYPNSRRPKTVYIPAPLNVQSEVEKALKNILGTTPVNNPTHTEDNPLMNFVSNNKWLVLAGVGFLAYTFLGAGKPKTREVTSISKY